MKEAPSCRQASYQQTMAVLWGLPGCSAQHLMCDIYNPGSRDLPEVQELDFGLLLASGALRSSTIVNDMILLSFWNALASEASGKPICYFRYWRYIAL